MINQDSINNSDLFKERSSRYNSFFGSFVPVESVKTEDISEPKIKFIEKKLLLRVDIKNGSSTDNIEESKKEKASKYEIVKPLKFINDHKSNSNIIFELSNGFIAITTYNNYLLLYTKSFEIILEIKFPYLINSMHEIKNSENKNTIEFCLFSIYYIYDITLDLEKCEMKIEKKEIQNINEKKENDLINDFQFDFNRQVKSFNYLFFIQMKDNQQIFCTNNGVYKGYNLLNIEEKYPRMILLEHYVGGIPLNDELICFKSNKLLIKGEDYLTLFDIKSNVIVNRITDYSYNISPYGLMLISENEKNKYVLCVCTKYSKEQKNGLLIVNYNLLPEDKIETKINFLDTEFFSINTICKLNINNNRGSKETEEIFLLAGGVDEEYIRGAVKLYKIDINKNETNIKFLQDIEVGNNAEGPISCVYQLKNGNIIVSSQIGNILLTEPNLDGYKDDLDDSF